MSTGQDLLWGWFNCWQCGWWQPYIIGLGCDVCGIWPCRPHESENESRGEDERMSSFDPKYDKDGVTHRSDRVIEPTCFPPWQFWRHRWVSFTVVRVASGYGRTDIKRHWLWPGRPSDG